MKMVKLVFVVTNTNDAGSENQRNHRIWFKPLLNLAMLCVMDPHKIFFYDTFSFI